MLDLIKTIPAARRRAARRGGTGHPEDRAADAGQATPAVAVAQQPMGASVEGLEVERE